MNLSRFFFTFNQNKHEQSVINNLIQTSDKYEENYDNYILTHEPKTEKGAKYINELEKMKAMLLEDKKAFENEIENISENFIEEKKKLKIF